MFLWQTGTLLWRRTHVHENLPESGLELLFSENSTVRAIADTMVPTTDIHVPMRSRRSATDLLEESSFTCSASSVWSNTQGYA